VCERAVPIEYLNQKCKEKSRDMKDLYSLIFYPQKCTEKKKKDPNEMDQDNDICKNLEEHFIRRSSFNIISNFIIG